MLCPARAPSALCSVTSNQLHFTFLISAHIQRGIGERKTRRRNSNIEQTKNGNGSYLAKQETWSKKTHTHKPTTRHASYSRAEVERAYATYSPMHLCTIQSAPLVPGNVLLRPSVHSSATDDDRRHSFHHLPSHGRMDGWEKRAAGGRERGGAGHTVK